VQPTSNTAQKLSNRLLVNMAFFLMV